ncbi:MAG TPA: glycosyltransferase family 39 protein [Verrucomicrobiae bacterium]|nr:glycosyltransferase family 39 protein [Verrucomicrobiae bacterium]
MNQPWVRTALALSVFAAVFITLTVTSYRQESATWDEPQHLIAGYTALKFHDYRTDPEHPPFLRMWAALPLLARHDIKMEVRVIDKVDPLAWIGTVQFEFCHGFLYVMNDADRLLYPARFMIVLLGVLLGILLFCWTREFLGFAPALIVLALYTMEPNILANSSLVTTDFGVTCFAFGTIYFLWRTARKLTPANLCGLIGFFTLAQISKFTAILLGPVVLLLLVARVCQRTPWRGSFGHSGELAGMGRKTLAGLAIFVALSLTAWLAIWASYGFRFLPSASNTWKMDFPADPSMQDRVPGIARVVGWADDHRLLPNAYLQGFFVTQAKAQVRGGFLAGQYSVQGWWYFFPLAFLIKTPVSVIVLFLGGLFLCAERRGGFFRDDLYALLSIAGFLGPAMAAKLNIGLRHILPIYPFVLLLAGKAVAKLWYTKRRPLQGLLGALCLLAVGELASVAPHYLAFFNRFVGGPRNGYKYLVDSSLDWGQDLKGLKGWMDENHVQHINLSYFGTADPAYYKIHCTHLPGAPFFDEKFVAPPELPGLVAVSATNLRGVYFTERWRDFYKPLSDTTPVVVIGYSIYVYQVERPWWQEPP